MENNSAFDSFELQLTDAAKGFLKETGKWATFLSIVGFIFLGFLILIAFMMFTMGASVFATMSPEMSAMGAAGGIIYLLIALLNFFPIWYLYKFGSNIKQAFAHNNTEQMTIALESLKSHYKFIGILMIIVLSFYVLSLLLVVAGIAGSAM